MPPMCLVVAILAGATMSFRWRRIGLTVVMLSALLLYACCTRFVADRLLLAVESTLPPTSPAALADAQAIAVLSGDVHAGGRGEADDVGLHTAARLRLAAELYRAHPLPILVTGAVTGKTHESAAALMARVLDQDYGIKTTWIEDRATTTFENGTYSAAIFKANNIERVIVVTEAWHLPRALWSFAHAGLTAIPAPAERTPRGARIGWREFAPDYSSFARSFFALHEMLGLVYYRYRYGAVTASN
jgi:uncharacterized SAM-binding protein YcdF (DUF218 family)